MLLVRPYAQKANDVEHCRALHRRASCGRRELLLVDVDVGEYEHEHEHVYEHEYDHDHEYV
jgi:hypothetical protein